MLLETMSRQQEENARMSVLVGSLREENKALAETHRAEMESLRKTLEDAYVSRAEKLRRDLEASYDARMVKLRNDLEEAHRKETASLMQTVETMRLTMEDMTAVNASMARQLADAVASGKLARGKRFAPTAEQSDLLNNRRTDRRAEEKDGFDGNPPAGGTAASGQSAAETDAGKKGARKKKKSEGRRPSLEDYECDEVVRHTLGEYFTLPPGSVFKTRGGKVEIHEHVCMEYIPGRIVRHVWETATYVDAVGDSHNTLPEEERETAVKGCPFTPEMIAFLLVEKYAYHTPKNRIKRKLREMGARFSKTSFCRYYHKSAKALREMLEPVFRKATMTCDYLMIDETCLLVGVHDGLTNIARYMKRYLWAFHNKASGLVSYIYEHGSRARKVVLDALLDFKGTITTDGYAAYVAFDDDDAHPGIMRTGCWTHVRRNFIEAIGVAGDVCHTFIEEIGILFYYETLFKAMTPADRKAARGNQSLHVVNRIFNYARTVAADAALMGRSLLAKAVNCLLNREKALRGFLKDGRAEISNNLCEQRMKPIKPDLKNSQNIGSEEAAMDSAFMHSLVESCRLNSRNPFEYLAMLIHKVRDDLDDAAKRLLLPDLWVPEC